MYLVISCLPATETASQYCLYSIYQIKPYPLVWGSWAFSIFFLFGSDHFLAASKSSKQLRSHYQTHSCYTTPLWAELVASLAKWSCCAIIFFMVYNVNTLQPSVALVFSSFKHWPPSRPAWGDTFFMNHYWAGFFPYPFIYKLLFILIFWCYSCWSARCQVARCTKCFHDLFYDTKMGDINNGVAVCQNKKFTLSCTTHEQLKQKYNLQNSLHKKMKRFHF